MTERRDDDPAADLWAPDQQLLAEVFSQLYPALRQRAERCMRGEAPGHTLQATALVHEVYVRLASHLRAFRDERHLYAVAVRVMRQVLVDHARARSAGKRGGRRARVPLENASQLADQHSAMFLELQDAVDRLRAQDPLRARIFELDFLIGLTHREIAGVVGIEEGQVKYALSVARARLRQLLTVEPTTPRSPEGEGSPPSDGR